jgi:hypothetical protein
MEIKRKEIEGKEVYEVIREITYKDDGMSELSNKIISKKRIDEESRIESLETAVKDLKLTLNKILEFMEAYTNEKDA